MANVKSFNGIVGFYAVNTTKLLTWEIRRDTLDGDVQLSRDDLKFAFLWSDREKEIQYKISVLLRVKCALDVMNSLMTILGTSS